MIRRYAMALLMMVAAGWTLSAGAQERGTKDEAKAMTDAAVDYIKKAGADKAYKDFTQDKAAWTKKDLYVFVFDNKGTFLAHGANDKLVGRDMSAMKDANGKLIFVAMKEVADSKGTGWVDYDWAHPQTKRVEGKSSYVRKVPGTDTLVGVGIYR